MARSGMEMFIMLPMLFLIQKIDFTVPNNVLIVQSAFVIIQTILLVACTYIYNKINTRNNRTVLNVAVPKPGEEPRTESQTVRDHDMAQLKKFGTQLLLGTTITAFLYYKWAIVPPLLMQSVLNPMNFYKTQLFKIYILGQDESEFPRPWKEESPLAGLMGGQQDPAPTEKVIEGEKVEEKSPKGKKHKTRKDE